MSSKPRRPFPLKSNASGLSCTVDDSTTYRSDVVSCAGYRRRNCRSPGDTSTGVGQSSASSATCTDERVSTDPVYREVQRFRQRWLWGLLAGLALPMALLGPLAIAGLAILGAVSVFIYSIRLRAEVVIANRSEESGRATAEELGCGFQQCDVSDYEQVERLVESTVDEYDRLDVMVNNAGIGRAGTVEEMTLKDWSDVIQINLTGVMYGSRAALPYLKQTDGAIINVASIYGLVAGPGSSAYSAAKGGVVNLTREIAVDYASEGVRVNSICPGFVETPMTDEFLDQDPFYEFVHGQTPMGRVAQPEEISGIAMSSRATKRRTSRARISRRWRWTAH